MQNSLRSLPRGFGGVFPAGKEAESDARLREVAKDFQAQLKARVAQELPLLPFSRCAGRGG